MFQEFKQKWDETDTKFKAILIAIVVGGVAFIFFNDRKNTEAAAKKATATAEAAPVVSAGGPQSAANPAKPFSWSALPTNNRNQGLEDLVTEVRVLRDELAKQKRDQGDAAAQKSNATTPTQRPAGVDLNAPIPNAAAPDAAAATAKTLPPPVKFDAAPDQAAQNSSSKPADSAYTPPEAPARPSMKIWEAEAAPKKAAAPEPKYIIPAHSALEAVMLSGINARPSGSIAGAIGSSTSANDVGAPFVSRIKGEALLPNGWKLNDLGDCFMGGSGVAVINAERAYAISNTVSCIAPNGDVFEAPIKAYALDVDGIQGIAGKVVSKQGSILLQALLTGMVSGFGAAITPTAIPASNTNATGGSTAFQTPDPHTVAAAALGNGIQTATAQLSRFYLDYAKEIFPVIEVLAGTRITWILKETVEFKRIRKSS